MDGIITSKLSRVNETMWHVTKSIDLVYSGGDDEREGKGWYLQQFPGGKCSELFASDYLAVKALKENKVIFS